MTCKNSTVSLLKTKKLAGYTENRPAKFLHIRSLGYNKAALSKSNKQTSAEILLSQNPLLCPQSGLFGRALEKYPQTALNVTIIRRFIICFQHRTLALHNRIED